MIESTRHRPNEHSAGRLTGPLLPLARTIWLILVGASILLFVVAIPIRYSEIIDFVVSSMPQGWTAEEFVIALEEAGISVRFFATYLSAVDIASVAISVTMALIIFWRRSDRWPAILISLWMVTFSTTAGATSVLQDSYPLAGSIEEFLSNIGWVALPPLVFFTFPDGRFVPRWARWLGLAWIVFPVLYEFVRLFVSEPGPADNEVSPLTVLVWATMWVAGALSQIYRYRRVSDPVGRQQTKWVVLGMSGTVLTILVLLSLSALFPWLEEPGRWGVLYGQLFTTTLLTIGFALIPLSVGLAILRFRLWDVDVIIRRTLVYGLVSALLLAIYVGSVVLLQSLFTAASSGLDVAGLESRSPAAIVISTLLIAALFNPLRVRVQDFIDRRFYRSKYDAVQTLADFAATARDEVELDVLTAELLRVVEETMRPEQVTLWLRPAEPRPELERQ